MMPSVHVDRCDECGTPLHQAGEHVPAGTYLRVDDGSFQRISLSAAGSLPASFDGHVALYRAAAAPCVCERRHAEAAYAVRPKAAAARSESVRSTHQPIPVAAGAARGDQGHDAG
jgi:hypothetical protein